MKFKLYSVTGYEEAINALRMSKGKFFSLEKAKEIKLLVDLVTDENGFIENVENYEIKKQMKKYYGYKKITGFYEDDINEFKRLLGLTKKNSMGEFDHHTLMKYIDISFFTDDFHRGGQDDLDAHAMRFGNRITRFSTRLADIEDVKLSEWYRDKVIPFNDAVIHLGIENELPQQIEVDGKVFDYTPFGYVYEKHSSVPAKNGLAKDVQRGLMPLGMGGCALWKIDLHELRYVYFRRSKLTKANPELKNGMEMLADEIESSIPVFGEHFRKQLTDSGTWEHMNKVRTISSDEWKEFKDWKKSIKK